MSALEQSSPLPSLLTEIRASGDSSLQPPSRFSCQLPTSDRTSDVSSDAPSTVCITIIVATAFAFAQPTPPSTAQADFTSNDYLSFSTPLYPPLLARVLTALKISPAIVGPDGSCLLIYNHAHTALEARLARTFCEPAALPPLQPGLRCQRRLLRVRTAAGQRATLRQPSTFRSTTERAHRADRSRAPGAPGRMCSARGSE